MTSQIRAPGNKASATTRDTSSLKRTYGVKAPLYLREVSKLFSVARQGKRRRRNSGGFCSSEQSEETCGLIRDNFGDVEIVKDNENSDAEMVEEEEREKDVAWAI